MEHFGQVIGLMHRAPHGASPTRPAQMPGVVCTAAMHLLPVAVANGADASTTITDHNRSVWRAFLVTHWSPSSLSCTPLCRRICNKYTIRNISSCIKHPNSTGSICQEGSGKVTPHTSSQRALCGIMHNDEVRMGHGYSFHRHTHKQTRTLRSGILRAARQSASDDGIAAGDVQSPVLHCPLCRDQYHGTSARIVREHTICVPSKRRIAFIRHRSGPPSRSESRHAARRL